uniref:cytochrome P450 704C1-like n=1 Tax=Erigeron canadensis TaxID=72917 RepID=UPI001CB90C8C|nr:cytochrome P450 704C1-like [Erigeron canadensis]
MAPFMNVFSNLIISIPVITTSSFFVLLFLYIYNQKQHHKKKYHLVVGSVLNLIINFNKVHDYLSDLAAKYKSYRLIVSLFRADVYTSDPMNVEYIVKTNYQNFGKGKKLRDIMKDLLGEGIFIVDGDKWREQRKVASHEFSTKVLRDFSSVVFRKNAIKLGDILLEAANNNQIIDINDLFMKATMDSIFKVAFGIDLNNMSSPNEDGIRFSRAFDDANTLTAGRFVDVLWKIKKFLNIGSEADMKKSMKVVDEFVYKVIQMKIEQMHKSKDEFSLKKEDILSRFLQVNDKDPKYLRDIILSFVLAGKDTVAITMTWLIYMLCKHPKIQDKVAREIKEAMKMKKEFTNVADFATLVTDDALENMHYLQATLTETIRFYPALPLDPKTCLSDDVLPDGCMVKKGDTISYLPYAMGRMEFIWGDDAQDFKPERWLDHDGRFHPESPFKFVAFQAGPRTCLGREFAYRQLKIFSSILLGCFMFKLSDENKVSSYRISVNLHIDGPLQICVFKRSGLHDQ